MEAPLLSPPNKKERENAREASAKIIDLTGVNPKETSAFLKLTSGDERQEEIEIPLKALEMLKQILRLMADGSAIQIFPLESEISTQQAADLLNVSRPHIVKLLEEGHIPFTKIRRHRRIKLKEILKFKEKQEKESQKAHIEMVKLSQELDLPLY